MWLAYSSLIIANIPGAYVHFAVRPDEALHAFSSLKYTSIGGVNVTLPLKSYAFEAADVATDEAASLGVANCLYKDGGKLIAHNTDIEGFKTPLIRKVGAGFFQNSPVIIFGTGGAARAVVRAFQTLGCQEIRICGRTDSRSDDLAAEVNSPAVYTVSWAKRHDAIKDVSVIVNATAGGMAGKPPLDVNLKGVHEDSLIYDLVYTPLKTPLMLAAEARGLQTLGGLDMLIEQARPSFKHFFGETPPFDLDPSAFLKAILKHKTS